MRLRVFDSRNSEFESKMASADGIAVLPAEPVLSKMSSNCDDQNHDSSSNDTVIIKKNISSKKRHLRKRRASSTSDAGDTSEDGLEEPVKAVLEETKVLQKLRKKPHGVNVVGLALGKKLSTEEELVVDDPFKLKTGGMIDMKALKKGRTGVEELDAVNLGNTFSAETNRRDEDADMMKYIEMELAKKKGLRPVEVTETPKKTIGLEDFNKNDSLKAEDVLFQVPEHLRHSSSKKSEEMLSNQMLSGIPEVDLGIEERIRNIEATEEAKQRLLKERMTKKENGPSFVPTNMAVNFVQHNRFNIEDSEPPKAKRIRENRPKPVVVIADADQAAPVMGMTTGHVNHHHKHKTKPDDDEKATDDFHFEKFKKQFRRY